jgi:hypothetical protein
MEDEHSSQDIIRPSSTSLLTLYILQLHIYQPDSCLMKCYRRCIIVIGTNSISMTCRSWSNMPVSPYIERYICMEARSRLYSAKITSKRSSLRQGTQTCQMMAQTPGAGRPRNLCNACDHHPCPIQYPVSSIQYHPTGQEGRRCSLPRARTSQSDFH